MGDNIDNVKVLVRVKPSFGAPSVVKVLPHLTALQVETKPDKQFFCDYIADEDAPQEFIFESLGKGVAESFVEGFHGTVFAYGQTSSGKSYTMFGSEDGTNKGLIMHMVEYIFNMLDSKKAIDPSFQYSCTCTYLEIYQDDIFDLFDVRQKRKIVVLPNAVEVKDVKLVALPSAKRASDFLDIGNSLRTTEFTMANDSSSRSHAVFSIHLETSYETDGVVKTRHSTMNMIDLAGSERQRDTGAVGDRLKEAGGINKSLLVLSEVIKYLSKASMTTGNVPQNPSRGLLRSSTLTKLLSESLSGNCKIGLIATVNPRAECANDTISTLEFASRAKMIKLSAKLNEDDYHRLSTGAQSAESVEQLLKLREEVSALGSENEELRNEIVALQRSEIEMEQTLLHQQASMYKQEQELAKITSLRDEIESREFALAEENCALQERLSQLEKVVETLTRTINTQTQAQISPRQPTPPAAIVISAAPAPLPASPAPNRANVSSAPTPIPKNDKKVPVPTVSEIFRQYDSDGDFDALQGDDYEEDGEEDEDDDEGRQSDAKDRNLGQEWEQKEAQIQELVARVSNLTNQLRCKDGEMELMQKRYESEIGILQHRVNEAIDERDSARAKATRTKSKYGKAKEKWNDEKYNMTIKINGLEDKLLKIEAEREERSATADDSVICASKSSKSARNRSAPSLELLMRSSLVIATPPRPSTSKRHVVTSNTNIQPAVEQRKYEDEETTDISKENFVLPANTPTKIFGTTIGGSAPGTPATPGTPGTPRSRKRNARRKDKKQLLKQLNM